MRVHGISADQIDLIPHGIPHVPVDAASKDRLGVDGKTVILTFGLLSRDKGIEHVIDALPAILAVHPDVVYIVLGATHPHVVEHRGRGISSDARSTRSAARGRGEYGFPQSVRQPGRADEILSAADIYITPYLQPEQITASGTLAYTVGAGKAVISTPYIYARELLADGRGVLVPWRDSRAIAREVIDLVSDRDRRRAMCASAAAYGVGMTWPAVGLRYVDSFARARAEHTHRQQTAFRAQTLAARPAGLPENTLKHVRAMTDDTGMLQHAIFSIPRYDDGYCLDDNARALLLMALLEEADSDDPAVVRALGSRYLACCQSCLRSSDWALSKLLVGTRGTGWNHAGRRTAMGEPCGRSAPLSGGQATPGARGLAGDLLPRRESCGDDLHESASMGLRAPRLRRVIEGLPGRQPRPQHDVTRSPIVCSACLNGRADPTGHGSRTRSPTATAVSRRR